MTDITDNTFDKVVTSAHYKHTQGHIDCPACQEMRAMYTCSITADIPFHQAASLYLKLRSLAATPGAVSARYIRENTEKDYERKLRAVSLFFGEMPLKEIHWYSMKAYQQARIAGTEPFVRYRRPQDAKPQKQGDVTRPAKGKTSCPAKAKQANQEMRLLKQIKVRARCWTDEDQAYFEYLQEDEGDSQRALSAQEQQRWLDVARSNPRWSVIFWWSIVSFDTLMSTNELRGLRLGDFNLQHRMIRVPWPAAKNRYRHRDIPIENPDVLWALDQLLERAHDLGAREPQHYLFPFKITRSKHAFPDRHMTVTGIKKLWEEVRAASGLTWFRMYDTRHTGATRFAESGVPPEIIMARLGHSSDKMRRHYTHVFEQAQRQWLRNAPSIHFAQRPPDPAIYGKQPAAQPPPRFSPQSDYSGYHPPSAFSYKK